MTLIGKFELGFGLATVPVCALAILFEEVPRIAPDFVTEFIAGMAVLFLPTVLVAIGSYLHAVRKKKNGFVLLWVSGVILVIWGVGGLFGGVLYVYGLWGGLIMLSPAVPAIAALIASLPVQRTIRSGRSM